MLLTCCLFLSITICNGFPTVNETYFSQENSTTTDYFSTSPLFITSIYPLEIFCFFFAGLFLGLTIARAHMKKALKRWNPYDIDPQEIGPPNKYKPVVIIHGLLDAKFTMNVLGGVIRVYHPGTEVNIIHLYNGLSSLTPLWEQVAKFQEVVEEIAASNPQGIHLIAVSQGTMIARGILSTSNKHNVHTFISVSGPLMGQFGLTCFQGIPGYNWLLKNIYRPFSTVFCQKYSPAEFWKDPFHIDLYKSTNVFLPILNNEVDHPRKAEFKKNFCQLKSLVLIGSPNDAVITPWQSSHFGFYDERGNIVEMKDQDAYKNDTFGLKTLDEKKAITIYAVPHIMHYFYAYDIPFIKQYILPHLT